LFCFLEHAVLHEMTSIVAGFSPTKKFKCPNCQREMLIDPTG
jgi:hypothetical protein